MAGLEFPTQKKPEAPTDESAFGGLPTPAWAMAKPKAAEKKEVAASGKKPVNAAGSKDEKEEGSVRRFLGAVLALDMLLGVVAVAAFAIVVTLIAWFWPELNWMVRRYL